MPNYYMRTSENRKTYLEHGASECLRCDANCLCSGKVINGPDTEERCDLGCVNDRFILTKGTEGNSDSCEISCDPRCEKCVWDEATSATKCLKCYENKMFNAVNGLLTAPLDSKNEC